MFVSVRKNGRGRGRISRIGLNSVIDGYLNKAGLKRKRVSCHALRHTCGTLLYDATKDIRAVQDTLRHENITTSAIYAASGREHKRFTRKIPLAIRTEPAPHHQAGSDSGHARPAPNDPDIRGDPMILWDHEGKPVVCDDKDLTPRVLNLISGISDRYDRGACPFCNRSYSQEISCHHLRNILPVDGDAYWHRAFIRIDTTQIPGHQHQ